MNEPNKRLKDEAENNSTVKKILKDVLANVETEISIGPFSNDSVCLEEGSQRKFNVYSTERNMKFNEEHYDNIANAALDVIGRVSRNYGLQAEYVSAFQKQMEKAGIDIDQKTRDEIANVYSRKEFFQKKSQVSSNYKLEMIDGILQPVKIPQRMQKFKEIIKFLDIESAKIYMEKSLDKIKNHSENKSVSVRIHASEILTDMGIVDVSNSDILIQIGSGSIKLLPEANQERVTIRGRKTDLSNHISQGGMVIIDPIDEKINNINIGKHALRKSNREVAIIDIKNAEIQIDHGYFKVDDQIINIIDHNVFPIKIEGVIPIEATAYNSDRHRAMQYKQARLTDKKVPNKNVKRPEKG